MSTNARWALALVGVVILITAAVVVGTGDDTPSATETDGTTQPSQQPTTGATGDSDKKSDDGSTSSSGDNGGNTGGASPDNGSGGSDGGSGNDSGGASPNPNPGGGSGGASPEPESGSGTSTGSSTGSDSGYLNTPILVAGRSIPLAAKKGEMVYLRAYSGTKDELHIHGYDFQVPVPAKKIARFKFRANVDGVFEIEMHSKGQEVAKLKVSP